MANLPLNLTGWGVQSDVLGDKFCIYFLSVHNARKVYLGTECVTENLDDALWSDDMSFVVEELHTLLNDQEFLDYLEGEMVF